METAIFADCKRLVENFVANGNSHFESFCVQWKTMMFQHIFSPQSNYVELLQTTAAAFHIAKRIAGGDEENTNSGDIEAKIRRRIGGIFLMYAIYFKQPTKKYVKIDVSLETWNKLKTFMDTLPICQATDDVRYTYWKLLQSNAFRFTGLDFCVGLENLIDYNKVEEEDLAGEQEEAIENANNKLKEEFHEFTNTQKILPALTVLEDGYNEMKEMLIKTDDTIAQNSLPPTTIFNDIKKTFTNIQRIVEEGNKKTKRALEKQEEKSESKRRALKRKGYKVTNSEEYIGIDLTDEKRYRLARRMSARTVFTEQLPQDMLEDLQEEDDDDSAGDEEDQINQNDESQEADQINQNDESLEEEKKPEQKIFNNDTGADMISLEEFLDV